ncbi:MAG TPA: RsmE family RNA methyltransferase [Kiritimatiellia bacterium]|jgi:RsmE family RNA methyltransferase|nr:RsmE family RNA methyltransferase [Kiritimatiellia bacterium]
MNRILFEPDEFLADGTVLLTDTRAEHLRQVLRADPGQIVATGTLNGLAGVSRVLSIGPDGVRLSPSHDVALPEPWLDLLLAVPRPKVLKRLWPQLAALGVGRVVLLNAAKVEKCYFSSRWIEPESYRPLLIEGLMQAGLTRLPEVMVAPRFKPFVEDDLERLFPETVRLLAHPRAPTGLPPCDSVRRMRPLLAVGPEGGWTDYETEHLLARGFHLFSLGERVLRFDTACIALIAVLEWCKRGTQNVERPTPKWT